MSGNCEAGTCDCNAPKHHDTTRFMAEQNAETNRRILLADMKRAGASGAEMYAVVDSWAAHVMQLETALAEEREKNERLRKVLGVSQDWRNSDELVGNTFRAVFGRPRFTRTLADKITDTLASGGVNLILKPKDGDEG